MGAQSKLIPIKCNLDLAAEAMDAMTARFIKNLSPYVGATDEYQGINEGKNLQKEKPLLANELYVNIALPAGDNYCVGAKGFAVTSEVYVMGWNSQGNHFIYRLNCSTREFEMVKVDPCFNFQKKPRHFMGESQITLTTIPLVNPETGVEFIAKELKWTDGFNYQGYLRVDDSIATNGFDSGSFPYFLGTYNKCPIVRMGLPTPKGCVSVTEVPRVTDPNSPDYDLPVNNNLLFQKWYFMVQYVDVWGRPSEWSARSLPYSPGVNDCISDSNTIPRCLDLEFDAGNPFINQINIAWLSCTNGTTTVWHKEETLFLYNGSNIGEWWKRTRNPDISYNPTTNKIKYRFCRTKECEIVPVDETTRFENPQPKKSEAIVSLNKNTALLNNKSGFNPFPKSLLDKIKVTVEPPTTGQTDLRNITIYVPIWNEGSGVGPKWSGVTKDGTNGYVFGGFPFGNFNPSWARGYKQGFKNASQSGFTGYLVGGGSVTSKQVYVDAAGNLIDDPNHSILLTNAYLFTLQKFEFNNVQKGTYIFRLASHLSDPNVDAGYRATSTTVWGTCNYSKVGNAYSVNTAGRSPVQELLIDVCNGDYNTLNDTKMLVIVDMASQFPVNNSPTFWQATAGYIHETQKNGHPENPVELINVLRTSGADYSSLITDHNGFYYFASIGLGRQFSFNLWYNCTRIQFRQTQFRFQGTVIHNYYMDEVENAKWKNFFDLPCNRILIKGRALLNGTNIAISNATVTISRGQTTTTDENGEFTIIAHDAYSGPRIDNVIINSSCGYTGPNGICVEVKNISIPNCSSCADRIITLSNFLLEYNIQRGLLSGGTYAVSIVGRDWLQRQTYAQQIGYITIPTINQTKAIAPSAVRVTIDPSATFPAEIEDVTFYITEETTIDKYVTWICDKVELIDAQGLVNPQAPQQIKIYFGSNTEFSKLNNYNTTTAWQFLAEQTNQPYTNDRVQFFLNGDGTFFDKAISGLVKYSKDGLYFTIDYVSSLKNLKENALIRIIRPKSCTGNEPYFEICSSLVEIRNRKAQRLNFILDAFDTYYLSRQIPVPAPQTATTVSITTTVTNGNTSVATQQIPVPTTTVLELRTFGFRFEHNCPSNFWGNCTMVGRIAYKNPYEAELIQQYQVALSGALSVNGQLNYLCYFDENKKTTFEVPESGGIVAAFPEIGKLFIVCQTDSFLVGYNDNLGRVNENGTFQAPSTPNEFGKPQRKEGDTYGSHINDKMAIRSRNGKIAFVDRNRAEVVRYDFGQIKSFTNGKCQGWFKAKCKDVMTSDNNYFTGAINPGTNEYILSNQSVNSTEYINQERTYNPLLKETVSFDLDTMDLMGWFSFVAENYAYLDGDLLNVQLFSFKEGLAYSHFNGKRNGPYNTFFGVKCEKVYWLVYNEDPSVKKMLWALQVYCENELFFADQITTESKQLSRILKDHFTKAAYYSYAGFLCDQNTIPDPNMPVATGANKLLDGDKLFGTWAEIRLIGDPDKKDNYCELFGVVITAAKYG